MQSLTWEVAIDVYLNYLRIERRLAQNTVEAYERDIRALWIFARKRKRGTPEKITEKEMLEFLMSLHEKMEREKKTGLERFALRA